MKGVPSVVIPFKKAHDQAIIPTFSEGNVGFDLYACESVIIPPLSVLKVKTGIIISDNIKCFQRASVNPIVMEPMTTFWKIEGRSGMAVKGIFPVGGIIDPGYRGEICGLMFNSHTHSVEIKAQEKFAQMVMYSALMHTKDFPVMFQEAEIVDTDRGDKGFGSSGA